MVETTNTTRFKMRGTIPREVLPDQPSCTLVAGRLEQR